MNSKPLLLGIDVGTTGTKSVISDTSGNILSQGYEEYPLSYPKEKWVECDPEGKWWNATINTVKQALKSKEVDSKDIEGISVSCTHAYLPVDKDGNSVRNAFMQYDKRATEQAEWIKENVGEDKVFKKAGNRVSPGGSGAPFILWMKENEPKLFNKTHKFLSPGGYIVLKLTGEFTWEWSRASSTLVFDTRGKREWDEELCNEMGIPIDKLPRSCPSWEIVGEVTDKAARRTGLTKGTPVVGGAMDNITAAIGTKAINPGDSFYVIGTVARLCVVMDEPNFDKRFLNCCHGVPDSYMAIPPQDAAGLSIRWFRDQFGRTEAEMGRRIGCDAYKLLDQEAEMSPPGAKKLLYLPYIAGGERSPIWDSNARGIFFGISQDNTKHDFIRAVLEGVAFALRHNLEVYEDDLGVEIDKIIMSGGGGKSPIWRQIKADMTGKRIIPTKNLDSEPIGNIILAGYGTGVYEDIEKPVDEIVETGEISEPNQKNHEYYGKLFEIYKEVYQNLKETFAKLSEIDSKP